MVFCTFCTFSILKHTILHSSTLCRTLLNKVQNLIFYLYILSNHYFFTNTIYLYGKPYTILHYVVDLVDKTTEMQACAHNETAHRLPACSRTPISVQLHTYKHHLSNLLYQKIYNCYIYMELTRCCYVLPTY